MTILIDIRPLMDKYYSGVSEYVFRLLQAIFAIDTQNKYILFCNAAGDVESRLPKFDQANVTVVTRHIPNKIFNYAMLWPFNRPRFDKLVGEKVDIFFMPHLQFASVSAGVKSILAIHDISFLVNPRFFSWRKNVWHWFVNARRLARRFDRVVAVSESTKQDLVRIAGVDEQRIRVIHSGILPEFKPMDEAATAEVRGRYGLAKPYIFFLATIEPRKNIEGLCEAFSILKEDEKYSDLELVIAGGRGWKAGPIFKALKHSAHASDIRILDYVPSEDRPALYAAASVFAFPSFYEGFGFPPLEAMACGTPVVVAANSSLFEIVGTAGILVDPYEPAAIARGIDEIMSNPALAQELSEAGIRQAAQFSWNNAAQAYIELFNELNNNVSS